MPVVMDGIEGSISFQQIGILLDAALVECDCHSLGAEWRKLTAAQAVERYVEREGEERIYEVWDLIDGLLRALK